MKYSAIALTMTSLLALSACDSAPQSAAPASTEQGAAMTIEQAVSHSDRTPAFVQRDAFRHPAETLAFFELEPSMTVVEIWPGGGYYSEILAPYLAEEGTFYAAHFPEESDSNYYQRSLSKFKERLASEAVFGNVQLTQFSPVTQLSSDIAPPNSADRVLTFRNLHNWYMNGGEEAVLNAFRQFHQALVPDGILGVVDHRLPESADDEAMANSGYIKESWVIELAQQAGFELVERSEINANPKDTADHPNGVWNLPPTLNVEEGDDAEIYKAIGESDRFTLKFRKPIE
ncbi:methyltransferase [Idiomarina sp. OT37-5b]|jgi:predicted methyltransferase|uniref:class I SAM-dependent methyltransferase n=1 Tax=Idiomarina sp. OT37-5b TaxID=2100422 RepID=UPI000CFA1B91|nr:class I SAM-dependent methyltransferase [Idiomarina sp. OT37-5b]AVJ56932.1 methyltransferase [Idiomarina sp. OT37-5b]